MFMENIKAYFLEDSVRNQVNKRIGKKATGWGWSIFRILLMSGLSFSLLYPILYMFSMAFRAKVDMSDVTVNWIPKTFTMYNLERVFVAFDYVPALIFSLILSFICAALCAITGSLTGYGFARFKFKGRDLLFVIVLMSIIVPATFYSMPTYLIYNKVNLLNNPLSMILPATFSAGLRGGLYVYLFRQFYLGLPKELEEAARIDGCGNFTTYIKIAIPSSISVFVTAFLFAFVWYWNDYQISRLFIQDFGGVQTLSASLSNVASVINSAYGYEAVNVNKQQFSLDKQAACLLVLGPLLLLYIFLQRYFVESIQRSGLAGD